MGITVDNTPNPMARKFTVGAPVGGPATFMDAATAEAPYDEVLAIDGVASLFITADFVTVTKTQNADWADLTEPISDILERSFA